MRITATAQPKLDYSRIVKQVALGLILSFYILYASLLVIGGTGPVDFDTFRDIGTRALNGQPVYGPNSYYPLPFVGIFAAFAALPRPVALLLWFGGQVAAGVAIAGPWAMAFAPLFAIQTAAPAMLGLWGYRKNGSGAWLALTTLKPQLALFPVAWAMWTWFREWRTSRHIPRQAIVFVATVSAIYLPCFLIYPGWVGDWLANPRGLAYRAMAGLLPRLLYGLPAPVYWSALLLVSITVFFILRRRMSLDLFTLLGFIVSPLVHDYDLIQMLPLADTSKKRAVLVLASLPLWFTVLFAYGNDAAWITAALIPPIYLAATHRH
jgi:hypothetical protein